MTDATEPLWLQLARSDLGLKEVAGAAANPRIVQMYAAVGHGECTSDEIAWCAASTGFWLKSAGLPIPPPNVNLLARSYLTHGVPCEPATVKELREAGSSDSATADTIKKVAIAAGGVASAGAAANQATAPPAIPTFPDVSITQATEQLSAVKMFMEGTYAVASLVFAHPWLAAGLVVAVGGYVVARKIERTRIRRAELGHALSRAG
jgi:hypothetical protein